MEGEFIWITGTRATYMLPMDVARMSEHSLRRRGDTARTIEGYADFDDH